MSACCPQPKPKGLIPDELVENYDPVGLEHKVRDVDLEADFLQMKIWLGVSGTSALAAPHSMTAFPRSA